MTGRFELAGPAPTTTLRPAGREDADALAELNLRGMRFAYESFVSRADLESVGRAELGERWREDLATRRPSTRTLVAEGRDRGVVGFVRVGRSRDDDARPGDGELHAIYVEPALVGTGVGHELLAAGEADLARDHPAATLWVLGPNEHARRFYGRHGWTVDDAPFDPARWGWATSIRYRKMLRPA